MKSGTLRYLLVLALLPAIQSAQTVYPAAAGTDQIATAMATAPPGSIIELTTSGGVYIESNTIVVDRALTFRAAADLAEKPVWVCNRRGIQIQILDDLTLEGISFDGELGDSLTQACIRTGVGEAVKVDYNLIVDNCDFKNYWDPPEDKGYVIYAEETTKADKVYFTNCTFNHIYREALRLSDGQVDPGTVQDMKVEHCTFWDIGDEAIYGEDHDSNLATPAGSFLVNHVTIYNAGSKCIYPKNMDHVVIKNSIVVKSKLYACRIYGTNSVVQNFLYYLCEDTNSINLSTGATEAQLAGILANVDPMFADSLNGDFTLDPSSPAVGAGEGGATLGDQRWWPAGAAVDDKAGALPFEIQLHQNFPNPFNPQTTIEFDLALSGHVTLQIFNLLGQEIATLIDGPMSAGHHAIEWNALDVASAGIYFYKLGMNGLSQIRKMVLLK